MKYFRPLTLALVASFAALVACSSDDAESSSNAATPSPCAEAKQVADDCNAKQTGSSKVTVNFDQAKCESSGDQGKKAAECIVANKSNCDCLVKCSLAGSCS